MKLEEIKDKLAMALQMDLENGVAWMNDIAWNQWEMKYPSLSKAIGEIMNAEEAVETQPVPDQRST